MGSSRFRVIMGASIAMHAGIAIWALLGDPIVDRPVMAETSGRIFIPDDVEAQMVFDASSMMASSIQLPAPVPPAPVPPAPVVPPAHAPRISHPAQGTLREPPSTKDVVAGLFADDHGLVSSRQPGADLQKQIDDAKRKNGTAQIGNVDPRFRGDDQRRTGTGPDCACDPSVSNPIPQAPRPDEPPPGPKPPIVTHKPISTLTASAVLDIITHQYMAGLERCQHELLRREGDVSGKVTLALRIDATGAIEDVDATGFDDGLDECIEHRAGAWTFPIPRDASTGDPAAASFRVSLAMQAE